MTIIRIKAKINPTEDQIKVAKAVNNLLGNIEVEINDDKKMLKAEINQVNLLYELKKKIAQDRIRNTLYSVFTRWKKQDSLSFGLNRQAAYAGHVSLNLENEDPMGPIHFEIKGNIDEVIKFLCKK
jgi:predicted RNA binding protein with dsRBD fold (UPF0201 family)